MSSGAILALLSLLLIPNLPTVSLFGGLPSAPGASAPDRAALQLAAAEASLRPLQPATAPTPWTNLTANLTTAPSAREGAALTYDTADNYVLLFGGLAAAGSMHDTWKFANGAWTNLTSGLTTYPPPRYKAVMAYDAKDGYVVLYGGRTSIYRNDTWKWSGGAWTQLHPTQSPAAREDAMVAYDRADGYLLLYGGEENSTLLDNDTWTFAGGTWTNLTANLTLAPPAREAGGMTFDSADNYVLLFGGKHGVNGLLRDTWSFHAGAWTNLTSALATTPTVRESPMFSDDAVDGFVLLYGGLHYPNALGDQWEFAHGVWTPVPGAAPPAREDGSLVYDHGGGAGFDLMFGGVSGPNNGTELGDTWAFKLALYPNLTVAGRSTVDLGESVALTVNVTGGYGYPSYAVGWLGLPNGCTGGNVTTVDCAPLSTGNYSVQAWAEDAVHTNATSDAVTFAVVPLPTVTGTVTPVVGDAPLTVTFNATPSNGTGPYNYSWNFGDGGQAATQNGTYVFLTQGSFNVSVNLTDATGATAGAFVASIQADAQLNVIVTATPPSGVAPLPVAFSVRVTGGVGPYTYAWNFAAGGLGSASASPSFTYTTPGVYNATVNVTDTTGATVSAVATVTVQSEPTLSASASASPTSGPAPLLVSFLGGATGGTGSYSYAWSFGVVGATSTAQDPTYTYTTAGTYQAILTVTDSASHSAQATATVTVAAGAPPLTANFTSAVAPPVCSSGSGVAQVNVTATATGGTGGYTYLWTFPGSTAKGASASAYVSAGDVSEITLSVNDTGGHASTVHANVTAAPITCSTTTSGTTSQSHLLLYAALAVILAVIAFEAFLLLRGRKGRPPAAPAR